MRRWLSAVLIGGTLLSAAAPAQAATVESKVPSALTQEILIKTTLLTLTDANATGNYTVLHAKLAKPFREQFNADRLKQVFKSFADQHIDWQMIAPKAPVATAETTIDKRAVLRWRGHFVATPTGPPAIAISSRRKANGSHSSST